MIRKNSKQTNGELLAVFIVISILLLILGQVPFGMALFSGSIVGIVIYNLLERCNII